MSGNLRPGAPVLAEVLADELGMSTTPAREGLQSLRVEGFLDLIPRHGFQVAPLSADDIRDLFRIQALIAGELAARAAASASAHELAELEALHHELIAAGSRGDTKLVEEKNHAFHRQVNLMANSRKSAWALGLLSRYVPREFYGTIPGWYETTMQDHAHLLQLLKDRDAAGARAAMEQHIGEAGEQLAEFFATNASQDAAVPNPLSGSKAAASPSE